MAKPSATTNQPRTSNAPAPAANGTSGKRNHVRKPLLELLATKLETSLETMTQLGHFAKSCAPTADPKFRPILEQLATAAESLGTATKTTLANYVKLIDGKFVPPENVRPIRPAGLSVGDKVTITPEFAPRYEAFSPWRGCTKETLTITCVEGSDYLLARPNGKGEVFVRSSKHITRAS